MPAYLSFVRRDPSTAVQDVHAMLYSYFPWTRPGDPRPFVWRMLAPDRLAVLSARPSAAPGCREVVLPAGVTLDFALAYKRVRNAGHRPVVLTDPAEMAERLRAFAAVRGVAVGFCRVVGQDRLHLPHKGRPPIALPVAHAAGKAVVVDPDKAAAMLASGGPGTGRAYGLGLWWLPEVMGAATPAATPVGAAA